jgi:neutral ceramidase
VIQRFSAAAVMAASLLFDPDAMPEAALTQSRPNIVIVLADDLGVNDLGVYGRKEHRTPHLDRLAADGLRFTSAYVASPICSPSRAALMTGRAPARLHLTTFIPGRADAPSQRLLHPPMLQRLPLEEVTLAERLREAGYATAAIGKWHLGGAGFTPLEQGFDVYHPGQATTKPSDAEGGKGEYDLTAEAERFIDTNRDRPFFLYLAHNNPHIPFVSAKPSLVEANSGAFEPSYAATVQTLDDSVGRLLGRIDAAGLRERTIVIFTSDNGGLHMPEGPHPRVTHNTPFRAGKGYLYEGGLRVPLIVRGPGLASKRVIDAPFINTDWLPTLLELAGAPPAGNLDGISQATLLRSGAPASAARTFFWHLPHYTNQGSRPAGAIRDGKWKLVEHYDDGRVELFDLSGDTGEARDLSKAEASRTSALRARLREWRTSVGAQENTRNPSVDMEMFKQIYVDFDSTRFDPLRADGDGWKAAARWRQLMDAATKRPAPSADQRPPRRLSAGAATSNITPPLGELIVGNWTPMPATHIHDELQARCLVLDDGETRVAIVVADNVGIPRRVLDEAKRLAHKSTGMPVDRILVASTHTHSATTARGSERYDPSEPLDHYQSFLAGRIADGIRRAVNNLEPARAGWGSGSLPGQVFNRRWFMKPGPHLNNPFGGTDQVQMNPQVGSPDLLKPAGPTDPEIGFLSVQSTSGRPIALLANYSLHYVGGVPNGHVSADYFGVFARKMADLIGRDNQSPAFVPMLSNGTSGNINNIDFRGGQTRLPNYERMELVANQVAAEVFRAMQRVEYHDSLPLEIAQRELTLETRRPTEKLMAWAREIMSRPESAPMRHPRERIYAERTLRMAEMPPRIDVPLQALRIGDLAIVTIPFEVFVEMGLELKASSPFPRTFTVSLANGAYGYLPTVAHHELGGYETWLGTNQVEVQAAPKIVATLLQMLREFRRPEGLRYE